MLPKEANVTGVILSDQVKSLDWRVRKAEFKESLPEEVINEVLAKLGTLLG
jgi:mRNA interferase MazF